MLRLKNIYQLLYSLLFARITGNPVDAWLSISTKMIVLHLIEQ